MGELKPPTSYTFPSLSVANPFADEVPPPVRSHCHLLVCAFVVKHKHERIETKKIIFSFLCF